MKLTKILLILATVIVAANAVSAQSKNREDKAQREIRAVMEAQVAAWNRGDIDGFMIGYWKSEKTTFSGKKLTRGWQTVLDNYKKSYDTPEKMGVLTFSNLEINVLAKDSAFVLGEWAIASKDNPKGYFTLVFRKFKEGWRVVHDQTS